MITSSIVEDPDHLQQLLIREKIVTSLRECQGKRQKRRYEIFSYVKEHDSKLIDPVWESVSLKIKKYIPFLNISMLEYRKHLIEQVQRKN